MKSKKTYRRVAVKKVCVDALIEQAVLFGGPQTTVGLDIAKKEIVVVVRWESDQFEQPWSVKNCSEVGELLELLKRLRLTCDGLRVGMESTGTYGDIVRRQLTLEGFDVQRVSGKAVSDYAEIFDGVPSQHDGKDAAMIAELVAFGKGTAWPYREDSEAEQQMKHQVRRLDAFQKQMNTWLGRIEGLMARHWPELTELLELNSATLLETLAHYGSPARLAADPEGRRNLRRWGRAGLKPQTIDRLLETAGQTRGVPTSESDRRWIQEVAGLALSALREVQGCTQALKQLVERSDDPAMRAIHSLSAEIGLVTTCVLWAAVGDPRNYDCAGAYLKALGLNLRECSSGKHQGQLKLTKRGPSIARRWLYFLALRAVQREEVKPWYAGKVNRDRQHGKMRGLIGVMRKLSRSIWHVRNTGEPFDWSKVFPGRPLAAVKRLPPTTECASCEPCVSSVGSVD